MTNSQVQAAEAYVQALRTGEPSAAMRAAQHLAKDVVLISGKDEFTGYDEVLTRITGQWPLTSVYLQGAWSAPQEDGDLVKVTAQLGPLGAAPSGVNLTFAFDAADQISRVEQEIAPPPPALVTDTIPDFVKGVVNNALANGTPMVVAYTDESGQPVLSLRGSIQVYGDTQLGMWLRNPESGVARALAHNPRMSLLYRDSKTRTTLIFQGRGHLESSEEVRTRVFELAPEVEQNHDPARRGVALIFDVDRLTGLTPRGAVRMPHEG